MRRLHNKKDANEPEIVAALNSVGAECVSCSGDPTLGFDLLILWRGRLFIAEVKDGSLPPSARRLTENELKRQAQCAGHGIRYLVLLNPDQALEAIGAKKVEGIGPNRDIVKPLEQEAKDAARQLIDVANRLKRSAA